MKLPVLAVLLVFAVSAVIAHPVNTHYLPKEYYQRQNLPERPGYIPVYIKHDDEPLIKWDENVKTRTNDETGKGTVDEKTENSSSTASQEQAQVEQKSKTKKVTENIQATKHKNKE